LSWRKSRREREACQRQLPFFALYLYILEKEGEIDDELKREGRIL
jgi:hypothetical protein